MRTCKQLNQVRPTQWLRQILVWLIKFLSFSSHVFFQSLLETTKASSILSLQGQGVLHICVKKNHLLVYEPTAWWADVLVLVLGEMVNNNFSFTFSTSFMLFQVAFQAPSFSRLKGPNLFVSASYRRYFTSLITFVLENFPSSTTSLLTLSGEERKESTQSHAP